MSAGAGMLMHRNALLWVLWAHFAAHAAMYGLWIALGSAPHPAMSLLAIFAASFVGTVAVMLERRK